MWTSLKKKSGFIDNWPTTGIGTLKATFTIDHRVGKGKGGALNDAFPNQMDDKNAI